MLLDVWLLHGMVMLLAVAWLGVKLFSCLQQTPKVRLPGSIPEKGQHFGAGNGACPLEEGLGVRCTVLPPGELHTKRIAVNHLKVSDPAAATMHRCCAHHMLPRQQPHCHGVLQESD